MLTNYYNSIWKTIKTNSNSWSTSSKTLSKISLNLLLKILKTISRDTFWITLTTKTKTPTLPILSNIWLIGILGYIPLKSPLLKKPQEKNLLMLLLSELINYTNKVNLTLLKLSLMTKLIFKSPLLFIAFWLMNRINYNMLTRLMIKSSQDWTLYSKKSQWVNMRLKVINTPLWS